MSPFMGYVMLGSAFLIIVSMGLMLSLIHI